MASMIPPESLLWSLMLRGEWAPVSMPRFDTRVPVTRKEAAGAFGKVLRSARHAVGLSQEALAYQAGFDQTYTSLLECSRRTPSLVQLLNLGPALTTRPGLLVDLTAISLGRASLPTSHAAPLAAAVRVSTNTARLCRLQGLNSGQLVIRTGLDQRLLLLVEAGSGDIPLSTVDALAEGLCCDVADLLATTDNGAMHRLSEDV